MAADRLLSTPKRGSFAGALFRASFTPLACGVALGRLDDCLSRTVEDEGLSPNASVGTTLQYTASSRAALDARASSQRGRARRSTGRALILKPGAAGRVTGRPRDIAWAVDSGATDTVIPPRILEGV